MLKVQNATKLIQEFLDKNFQQMEILVTVAIVSTERYVHKASRIPLS